MDTIINWIIFIGYIFAMWEIFDLRRKNRLLSEELLEYHRMYDELKVAVVKLKDAVREAEFLAVEERNKNGKA